jgi:ssDNA thymidine ADP-ribosyltransferase, DarT
MIYTNLNPEKALIWRIIHRDNLSWVLKHGLQCGNGAKPAPHWVSIGNAELIDKRARHVVPAPPGGYLNDYVPFYFTPFSVMMRNIHSGRGGVQRRENDEIVILVSSLHHVAKQGLPFLFTDMHAYYRWAKYYNDLTRLDQVDWKLLQARDFKRDDNDPAKFERYQAEALIHQHCPVSGLIGIVCHSETGKMRAQAQVAAQGLNLQVHARPGWYF